MLHRPRTNVTFHPVHCMTVSELMSFDYFSNPFLQTEKQNEFTFDTESDDDVSIDEFITHIENICRSATGLHIDGYVNNGLRMKIKKEDVKLTRSNDNSTITITIDKIAIYDQLTEMDDGCLGWPFQLKYDRVQDGNAYKLQCMVTSTPQIRSIFSGEQLGLVDQLPIEDTSPEEELNALSYVIEHLPEDSPYRESANSLLAEVRAADSLTNATCREILQRTTKFLNIMTTEVPITTEHYAGGSRDTANPRYYQAIEEYKAYASKTHTHGILKVVGGLMLSLVLAAIFAAAIVALVVFTAGCATPAVAGILCAGTLGASISPFALCGSVALMFSGRRSLRVSEKMNEIEAATPDGHRFPVLRTGP